MAIQKFKLKDLNKTLTELHKTKRQHFNKECNRNGNATYYNKINSPWTCTEKEKQVLAEIFNVTVDQIDWEKKKTFVA